MKKTTKLIIGAVLLAAAIAVTSLINYLVSVKRYQDTIANMTFTHTDATGIPDGTYIGECDVKYVYARVQVTVHNEKITDIVLLEHRNERGSNAEGIEKEIVARQRVDVDAVSGATNSSQTIKKAVDNALSGALGN